MYILNGMLNMAYSHEIIQQFETYFFRCICSCTTVFPTLKAYICA